MGVFQLLFGSRPERSSDSQKPEKQASEGSDEEFIGQKRQREAQVREARSDLESLAKTIKKDDLLGGHADRKMRNLEQAVERLEEAGNYRQRRSARRSLRKEFRGVKKDLQKAYQKEMKEYADGLKKEGVGEKEMERELRRKRREWNRKLKSDVRGMSRTLHSGGSFRLRKPKF